MKRTLIFCKHICVLTMLACLFVTSCQKTENSTTIINKTIEVSGGNNFNKKEISFDFRDRSYRSVREDGRFELARITKDSVTTADIVTNDSFLRTVNGKKIKVADSMTVKYRNSVNAVHYFAYLPYGLDGNAVNKELLDIITINNKEYFKIKVWFDQQGGGEDYEDIYVYWVNTDSYQVDYLAYKYYSDGGGLRFREAYNHRTINGIDFVDYNNFKPKDRSTPLFQLDNLFEIGELQQVSVIELKNIEVKDCSGCDFWAD
ncbi:deoxyribose-phosphate aldolase [Galbibacter sp. EGI 63066]|uniref:DUF6503 family protein n=1 Tax=Galbibacter sp. EGI 63066 TaxID=2993559 RepID=UPI0022492442|nr:DUF6503 family protein [Galbibacter sp. EGI 63066]MCX2681852.1 deoxyribose-phosphate aldolase [Galbibacter sp. EGI 63066]